LNMLSKICIFHKAFQGLKYILSIARFYANL